MEKFVSPIQVILDSKGLPLSSGFLHIGVANLNPIVNHIPVYWDSSATKPATNPVRIKNGMLYNGASPATLFVGGDCSFAVVDNLNRVVMSVPTMDAGLSIPISRITIDQDIDLNSHKVTKVANATAETDGINLGQARNELYRLATSVSGIDTNAIIASFSPQITSLVNGMRIKFSVPLGGVKNTSTVVTFTPNSGVIVPKRVVFNRKTGIEIGSIYYGIRELEYNSTMDKWILLNPELASSPILNANMFVYANPVSHTMNVSYSPIAGAALAFSSSINGGYIFSSNFDSSFYNLEIPYGATLGTNVNNKETILLLAVYDGTTIYPAITNSKGFSYDENSLINTTELTSGSINEGVVYANQVLTNAAFRILGFFESTQTLAAGQWDTNPSRYLDALSSEPTCQIFASTWTTPIPAAGVQLTADHPFGTLPFKSTLELKCLTAENGYSIGDIVECVQWGSYQTINLWKSSTQVGAGLPAGNDFRILNKTTGALAVPTKANWAYRFLLTR